ncbi:MAG: hypothetical protein MZW92_75780 [Comamonadaceae bacterium]|nr:hypothetical protein [Comamonadaceae bacterium]
MPPTAREGILFIDDSQIYESLGAMVAEFAKWGRTFAPAPVGFQYGYQTDKPWWSRMKDPVGRDRRPHPGRDAEHGDAHLGRFLGPRRLPARPGQGRRVCRRENRGDRAQRRSHPGPAPGPSPPNGSPWPSSSTSTSCILAAALIAGIRPSRRSAGRLARPALRLRERRGLGRGQPLQRRRLRRPVHPAPGPGRPAARGRGVRLAPSSLLVLRHGPVSLRLGLSLASWRRAVVGLPLPGPRPASSPARRSPSSSGWRSSSKACAPGRSA